MGRARAAAALLTAACALPAQAQQNAQRPLMLALPPADPAAPRYDDPRLAAGPDNDGPGGCAPIWPCRLQLFGVIERNGGVGLKGTALTW